MDISKFAAVFVTNMNSLLLLIDFILYSILEQESFSSHVQCVNMESYLIRSLQKSDLIGREDIKMERAYGSHEANLSREYLDQYRCICITVVTDTVLCRLIHLSSDMFGNERQNGLCSMLDQKEGIHFAK